MSFTNFIILLHALGSLFFLGNIIYAFFWKVMANKNGDTRVIQYGQKNLAYVDGLFTTSSTTVIAITGYTLAKLSGYHIFTTGWLLWSQIFFYGSAAIWALLLVPIGIKQLSLIKKLEPTDEIPERYWSLAKKWNALWIAATILPLMSFILMVIKPDM